MNPPEPHCGACGDDCSCCPRFLASMQDEHLALERVKGLWVKIGLRSAAVDPAALRCSGCCPENECAYPDLRACVAARGHDNCGQCVEYPCDVINAAILKTDRFFAALESGRCTIEEKTQLMNAFGTKKKNLDAVCRNHFDRKEG